MVDLSVDLQTTLWTVGQAAEAAQVSPNVVHNWRYRGHLKVAGRDRKDRPMFRAIDVIAAEKATRERARRTYQAA
ncbi:MULTISPECIES: MerR family transcriptional regulator [unclassified Streptomyces]|uniref:MerR family transcriptional regulator n=1 Tax=unclassified Streptomyces TaxID=2593676 RepID=UPI00278C422C|nr:MULTISPECIES: MerR family transcriptional regulator [unclassified Streptomyces]